METKWKKYMQKIHEQNNKKSIKKNNGIWKMLLKIIEKNTINAKWMGYSISSDILNFVPIIVTVVIFRNISS